MEFPTNPKLLNILGFILKSEEYILKEILYLILPLSKKKDEVST